MPKIKIRKSRLVPYGARILGTVALVMIYGWLLQQVSESTFILLGILLAPSLPALWMSYYVLEVNDDARYWWTYRWILGFKLGIKTHYQSIRNLTLREKVIKNRKGEEVIRYEGVVIFDDGSTCQLTRKKNLEFMREKMEQLAHKVSVPFVDDTVEV